MTKPILLLFLSAALALASCRKPKDEAPIASPEFNYSTTQNLSINLRFVSSDNQPLRFVLVNFYFPENLNADKAVFKALTDENGYVKGHFAAPAYKTGLIVDLNYPGIARNITFLLKDREIEGVIKSTSKISLSNKVLSDADGDFVQDEYDEFPNDKERAYTLYYPSKSGWGTLVFEDNWPSKGDFDMNDLVVKYNYAMVCDYRGFYKEVSGKYTVPAAGATYANGFGVNLPFYDFFGLLPIESVTGHRLTENYIMLNSRGFEYGTNIIPFDNAKSMLGGNTGMINTIAGQPKITSDTVTVQVKLRYPIDMAFNTGTKSFKMNTWYLWDVPFNPFLIANGRRAYEVHQKGYAATTSATSAGLNSLLGTADDASPLNYYYNDLNMFSSKDGKKPWVLNFAESFDYPVESQSISNAYLHFDEWAAGQGYADWYLDKPGYRNSSLIYK